MCQGQSTEVTGRGGGLVKMTVAGKTTETEHDAGMLNGVIGVEELCTNGTDGWTKRPAHHLDEPVGINDLGVVVQ